MGFSVHVSPQHFPDLWFDEGGDGEAMGNGDARLNIHEHGHYDYVWDCWLRDLYHVNSGWAGVGVKIQNQLEHDLDIEN